VEPVAAGPEPPAPPGDAADPDCRGARPPSFAIRSAEAASDVPDAGPVVVPGDRLAISSRQAAEAFVPAKARSAAPANKNEDRFIFGVPSICLSGELGMQDAVPVNSRRLLAIIASIA
jgi:hypothetical protein